MAAAENEIRLSAIDSMKKKEQHRRIEVKLNDDIAVKKAWSVAVAWMCGLKRKMYNPVLNLQCS